MTRGVGRPISVSVNGGGYWGTLQVAMMGMVLLCVVADAPVIAQTSTLMQQHAEDLKGGVVRIEAQKENKEVGTGVVLTSTPDSVIILTALHVVQGARSITIIFHDNQMKPYVAHQLPKYSTALDLAVIEVDSAPGARVPAGFPVFKFAANSALQETQHIWSMNNEWTLVPNNVTGLSHDGDPQKFEYSNVSVGAGFSGGPIFDDDTELIGMHDALSGDRSFAIGVKIDSALQVLKALGYSFPITTSTNNCITPPKGLVSWWPGDGKMNDIVGKNDPSGANAVAFSPGEVDYGFTFGPKGWIQIAASPSLANQVFTWAAWVRVDGAIPTNDSMGAAILGQVTGGTGSPTVVPVQLLWRQMDARFVFVFGNPRVDKLVSEHSFPWGAFYFLAAEYDGHEFKLFVNGVLEASATLQKTVPYSTSTPWTFGQGGMFAIDSYPRTWNGVIDEVQAFNRDLTQAEIEAIYNAGSKGECKRP